MKLGLLFLAIFFLSITSSAQDNTIEKKPPNLLFIITDQQRFDALSYAGNTVLKTPNMDRLASEGVYLENAYTQMAVCTPARASILTGHTVENTKMTTNKVVSI